MSAQSARAKKIYRCRRVAVLVIALFLVGFLGFCLGNKIVNRTEPPSEAVSATEPSMQLSDDFSEPKEMHDPESMSESEVSDDPESKPEIDLTAWNLILVNSPNPLPADFQVELEVVTESFKVDSRIAVPLKQMIAQAKEDGINLLICSAYRSVAYQQTLVEDSVNTYMSQGKTEEEARSMTAMWIAEPGSSEHHTGLALDIVTSDYQDLDYGFSKTRAFDWLDKNAHLFGFILRYPEDKVEITKIDYEPWHYRYVGKDSALEIKNMGICLEEYLYMKSRPITPVSLLEEDAAEPGLSDGVGENKQE